MEKVAEYRRRADEVRKLAETMHGADERGNLIALANLWTKLAVQREHALV